MNLTEKVARIAVGRRALKEGQFDRAARIAAEILAAEPRNVDALEIKALAESECGNDGAAERTLRAAIRIAPDRRWPYADLSRLLVKAGRLADAQIVARDALKADSKDADAHAMLGSLLAEEEQWIEACDHFGRAIALAGPHPQLLAGLGQAELRRGHLNEAHRTLQRAVASDPTALEPAVYLAEVEERLGRFSQASAQLDRAEKIARARGTDVDLQRSVLLRRMGAVEDALALLDHREDLSGAALLERGRLRERVGHYSEAWSDWMSGKALLAAKRRHSYDWRDVRAQADALAAFFNTQRVATLPRADWRGDVPQPIFIVGFPRSGTTLAEQILASHSAIRAAGELTLGNQLREFAGKLAGGEAAFPQGLSRFGDWSNLLRDLYLKCAETLGLLAGGADYFTDKMPSNDRWLPLLRLAFPQSPVILIRRHPLDVLTSVMAHDMTHGFKCAYRLEDAARHLALTDRLLEQYRAAGVGPTVELGYETLVAHQQSETERLMNSLELPLETAQLRFYERRDVSPTPSYAQVQEPLNDRSIGRWRNFEHELKAIQPLVGEAMARGGYTA